MCSQRSEWGIHLFLWSWCQTEHISRILLVTRQSVRYMTVGNRSSKICQRPWPHSVVMVAVLPRPIKNRNIPNKWLDQQRQPSQELLNEVVWWVLDPLTFKQNPSAESGYYKVLCADGNFRHCKPVLAACLADCTDYSDLHHLERYVCFWCECPKNELGDYVPPDNQHPRRDHNL